MKNELIKNLINNLKSNKMGLISLIMIILFFIIAIFAPLIAPFDPTFIHENALRLAPGERFLLGTDDVGRDILSRLVYGGRLSLGIGLMVVIFTTVVGTLWGALCGYFQGSFDTFSMRLMDLILSLPSILLAMVVVAILGPGFLNAIIAVSIVAVPSFVRLTRAQVLVEKNKNYVVASKMFGASHLRLIFRVILPNCFSPLLVQATLNFSEGILNAAALGFLGLGAQAPTPEWGTMLADARGYIEQSPWMVTLPGLCILLTVLSFNIFGDVLRDALDPKLRGR